MVAERKVIDIDDSPALEALADELVRHPAGVELRRGGKAFGILLPPGNAADANLPYRMSPDEVEQFRSAAGSWVGMVDFDELEADREGSRRLNLEHARTPPVGWTETGKE